MSDLKIIVLLVLCGGLSNVSHLKPMLHQIYAWQFCMFYSVMPLMEQKTCSKPAELFNTITVACQGFLQSTASNVSMGMLMKQYILGYLISWCVKLQL